MYTLTQADVTFPWNDDCVDVFERLEQCLTKTPVLAYPSFGPEATELILQTDASAVGLGAVLEQDGHPIAYVSRSLTKSECMQLQRYSARILSHSVFIEAIPSLLTRSTV